MAVHDGDIAATRFNPFPPLLRWLAAAGALIASVSSAMACGREAERLMQLSDEELAKRGLTRDRIVQYAFGRYLND